MRGEFRNPKTNFSSYFLSFDGASSRIELMHRPDVSTFFGDHSNYLGLTYFAISVGDKDMVNRLTERSRADGYHILSEPRETGDGYYESVVADCEENWVEINE